MGINTQSLAATATRTTLVATLTTTMLMTAGATTEGEDMDDDGYILRRQGRGRRRW